MSMKWVRAKDGAVFGVCKGLSRSFDIPVGALRLFWIASILFFGMGIGPYIILAISLPREDKVAEANEPWILGVCSKLARRLEMEVGLVRFFTIAFAFVSGGFVILGYLLLYFVLEDQSSESKPTTPPSTT